MTDIFNEEYIDDISLTNPSTNVTDENINLPLMELKHNSDFLMNLLSLSTASSPNLLSLIYGNLLDYDSTGKKIFFNGGNLDCFEKKHSWIAVNDGAVANDTEIQNSGAAKLLVYKGGVSFIDAGGIEHGKYIQREFFIPQFLRGSELIFGIKGTGVYLSSQSELVPFDYNIPYCNSSTVPNISAVGTPPVITFGTTGTTGIGTSGTSGTSGVGTSGTSGFVYDLSTGCHARYEDIGIEIIGATATIQEIETIGPWPHHKQYAEQNEWLPEYRTKYVIFKVGKNTSSIKIRIRRTREDGAIAISQMFLGGLPQPFTDYDLFNADINELYNFTYGITKWNVSTVNGRHVSEVCGNSKLSNLMTKEQWLCLQQFNRNIEEFDWDQETGPRPNELEIPSGPPGITPQTHVLEFDPDFTRYCYFDMRVDGPNPGLCSLGISYFINSNDFSETPACSGSCGTVKFDVWVAVVNTNDFGNPSDTQYRKFSYLVPIPADAVDGKMGYFEVYGDFYQDLLNQRGAIVYFVLSRDGSDATDTLQGNFLLAGCKTGIAVPPDDMPNAGTYINLFVGSNNDC
jgi:hypothetical protein